MANDTHAERTEFGKFLPAGSDLELRRILAKHLIISMKQLIVCIAFFYVRSAITRLWHNK